MNDAANLLIPDRGTSAAERGTSTAPHRQTTEGPGPIGNVELTVGHREVTVGEPISLSIEPLPFLASATFSALSTQWNIPGAVVKRYVHTLEIGKVIRLTDQDRRYSSITFYWIDGGDGRKVTAECVVQSRFKQTNVTVVFSWIFDVKAPTLLYLKDPRPPAQRGHTRIGRSRGKPALEFTAPDVEMRRGRVVQRGPGTRWDWSILVPQNHDGEVKDLQTLYGTRQFTRYLGPDNDKTTTATFRVKKNDVVPPLVEMPGADPPRGYLVLDALPGDEPRYGPEYPRPVKTGSPDGDIGAGPDSPDNTLGNPESQARFFVHERFKYFLMFKSNKTGSIWVTVGMAQWYWKGNVVSDRRTWRLKEAKGGVLKQGLATAELPVYEDHAAYLDYVDDLP
jgi:hypothetical protein